MFDIGYHIQIGTYKLGLLESVEIHKSVDLLTQTAVIVLPGVVYNQSLDHENYIEEGDKALVKLGYDGELINEFEGYVQRIDTDDDSLTINCEDSMYLTRKPVKDKLFNNTSIKAIAEYCLSEIGFKSLVCSYDITFQKFVIKSANAFDVFKKLKDDTKAQIYMIGDMLHVHPPYIQKGGDVVYDFAVNIEESSLKYRNKDDRKFEVEVEGVGLDGKRKKVTMGVTGGEKRSVIVANVMSDSELKKRGESELKYLSYDGYEGTITGWLIPYVEPTWSAKIVDKDYEHKTGTYYVNAVTTSLSREGDIRTIELGRKLS